MASESRPVGTKTLPLLSTGRTRLIFDVIAVRVLLLVLGLCAAEAALRAMGYEGWTEQITHVGLHPIVTQKDPEIGWTAKPGVHTLTYAGRQREITILPTGERKVNADAIEGAERPQVVILGDSCTFGWGISDEDTFAWRLQTELPSVRVRAFAVPGYGLLQNLLLLKRLIRDGMPRGSVILLGLAAYYGERDTGGLQWAEMLSRGDPEHNVEVPVADVTKDSALAVSPPRRYFLGLFGREELAIVRIAEKVYAGLASWPRVAHMTKVEQALLDQFAREAAAAGLRLVILLSSPDVASGPLFDFSQKNGLETLSCVHPAHGSPETQLPGDTHPSEVVHAYWAQCVAAYLRKLPRGMSLGNDAQEGTGLHFE